MSKSKILTHLNSKEKPRKHLYARFALNDKWQMKNDKAVNSICLSSFPTGEGGRGFFKASLPALNIFSQRYRKQYRLA